MNTNSPPILPGRSDWSALALIALAVLAIYLRAIGFEYVWDDRILFINNVDLQPGGLRWRRLFEPVMADSTYFRPVVLLSFVIEFFAFGIRSQVSHLVNILFFTGNAWLVFLLAKRASLTARSGQDFYFWALGCALCYAVIPVNIEAVAWVSGRFDLMTTFFSLLSLYLALQHEKPVARRAVAVFVFYLLALGSKEMAITVPVIYLLILALRLDLKAMWVRRRLDLKLQRDEWAMVGAYAAALGVYLLARLAWMPGFVHHDDTLKLDAFGHIAFVAQTLLFYVKKLFLPFIDVCVIHSFNLAELSVPEQIAGLLVALTIVGFSAWLVVKRSMVFLWLFMVMVALTPVLNIITLTIGGAIGNERFLAFPSALFLIGMADIGAHYRQYFQKKFIKWCALIFLGLWFGVNALSSVQIVPFWQTQYYLWKYNFMLKPDDGRVRELYLNETLYRGYFQEYEAVIAKFPIKTEADKLMHAYYFYRNKNYAAVIPPYKTYMDKHHRDQVFAPDFVYDILGESYLFTRQPQAALEVVDFGLKNYASRTRLLILRSLALSALGNPQQGEAEFQKVLSMAPVQQRKDIIEFRDRYIREVGLPGKTATAAAAPATAAGTATPPAP